MAGNKSITKSIIVNRKKFITQPKHMVFIGFVISAKKMLFVLGMAHGDPIFAKVGPNMVTFRGFSKTFSELLDSN